LELAQDAANMARASLASYWNGTPDFEPDMSAFENISGAADTADDPQNADLALLQAQERTAAARVALEQARGVQDPTWYAGIRRFEQADAFALVAGLKLSLPIYDDNSGNIARARAERQAADHDLAALRVTRQREILRLVAYIAASRVEAHRLAAEIIPQSQRALDLAQEGFGRGAFDYIDVLGAERALADARSRQVDVLKDYHLNMARLNRLTGRHAAIMQHRENR
ncbi:MAG: TolC family protein, partial [Proteobacteria bacterium]|nr:TolC family protein [Pseudomonadota bacterium]